MTDESAPAALFLTVTFNGFISDMVFTVASLPPVSYGVCFDATASTDRFIQGRRSSGEYRGFSSFSALAPRQPVEQRCENHPGLPANFSPDPLQYVDVLSAAWAEPQS